MKTDPNHKARFSYGCAAICSCGWSGATWFGKGSKRNAAGEWRWHRERCDLRLNAADGRTPPRKGEASS